MTRVKLFRVQRSRFVQKKIIIAGSARPLTWCEKSGVVGGKEGRIVFQDRGDGRVFFKFTFEEPPHLLPVPSPGMSESGIERQVAFIELPGLVVPRFRAASGHIEDRKVQERGLIAVFDNELKRLPRFGNRLRRCTEQEIDVCGYPRFSQIFQN